MAAIDSLLALIEAQKATGIVLREREAPALIGSQGRGLTMPPLDGEILETFAAEALAPGDLERLRASGACDAVYRSERHGSFAVEARMNADKLSLKLLRSGAVLAKPAPTAPVTSRLAGVPAPVSDAAILPAPSRAVSSGASTSSRLAGLIARAVDDTVSDIIVSAGQPLWIRTATGLAASGETIDQQEILGFVDSLLDPPRRRCLDESGSVDLAWEAPAVDTQGSQRMRVNVFRQAHGLALACGRSTAAPQPWPN